IVARQVSNGATTTVSCNSPFTNPPTPCTSNGTSIQATISGLSNCTAYDVTVTATNANGSTDSDPVTDVTPRVLPTLPSGLQVPRTANSGQLLFSWTASSGGNCGTPTYTVRLQPPADVSCGNGNGVVCQTSTGTTTSITMTTSAGVCNYPTFDCNTFRRS